MARYYNIDKLKEMIEAKADTLIEGKEAFLYVARWLNLLTTADVVPRAEVEGLRELNNNLLEAGQERQKRAEQLEYILLGVMHSVDKWLDGDELEQDEVNRAATMREKTLRLVEGLQAEVERLEGELIVERTRRKNAVNAYHSAKAEVARVIFEDLESICLRHVCRYNRYLIYSEDFAALKTKYTEGGAKNEES